MSAAERAARGSAFADGAALRQKVDVFQDHIRQQRERIARLEADLDKVKLERDLARRERDVAIAERRREERRRSRTPVPRRDRVPEKGCISRSESAGARASAYDYLELLTEEQDAALPAPASPDSLAWKECFAEGDSIVFYTAEGERVAVSARGVGLVAAERMVHAAWWRYSRGASLSIVVDKLDHDLIYYHDEVGWRSMEGCTRTRAIDSMRRDRTGRG